MTTYTLTITEQQARTISVACELLGRLGIGQWPEFIRHLPGDSTNAYELEEALRPIIADWLARNPIGKSKTIINGWQSSLGVGNPDAAPGAHIAFDLHKVIRHKLAWDEAIKQGLTDGTRRDWTTMMGVYFDEPIRHVEEPLATIRRGAQDQPEIADLLCQLVDQLGGKARNGNAPGHGHRKPGIWDCDNGALANQPCAWCELWQRAVAMREQLREGQP